MNLIDVSDNAVTVNGHLLEFPLSIIKAKQVATMISIIGNVAPSVLMSLIGGEEEESDSKDEKTEDSNDDKGIG